jgi:transposase
MVHRKWPACCSRRLYRKRNLIERFFHKIRNFRRVARRYEKHATNYLAMLKLASTKLWLRHYEPMT